MSSDLKIVLSCPACEAKFKVLQHILLPAGRKVRCAQCKHTWHQNYVDDAAILNTGKPEEPTDLDSLLGIGQASPSRIDTASNIETTTGTSIKDFLNDAEDLPSTPQSYIKKSDLDVERTLESGNHESDKTSDIAAPSRKAKGEIKSIPAAVRPHASTKSNSEKGFKNQLRRMWPFLALGFVLIGVFVAAMLSYPTIMKMIDKKNHNTTETPAVVEEPPALGLRIEDVRSLEKLQDAAVVFEISGVIVNPRDKEVKLSPMIGKVFGGTELLYEWTFTLPEKVIAPSASIPFNVIVDQKLANATRVMLTFSDKIPVEVPPPVAAAEGKTTAKDGHGTVHATEKTHEKSVAKKKPTKKKAPDKHKKSAAKKDAGHH